MRARSPLVLVSSALLPLAVAAFYSQQGCSSTAISRSAAESFGNHPAYGIAGVGVNTATGNFTTTVTDLSFSVKLLVWRRTYNSLDPAVGSLGRGWTAALSAQLSIEADGSVVLTDQDGRRLTFVPEGGGFRRPPDLDADLRREDGGRFSLRFLNGTIWSFDAVGTLTGLAHDGEDVALAYDGAGRLASATHSAGSVLTLSYEGERLAGVASSDGRSVSYQYGDDGTLAQVTGVDGEITRYEATPSGRLGAVVDPEGRRVLANIYDDAGRVAHQTLARGGDVDFAYGDDGVTVVSTPATGARVEARHDSAGRLTGATDPDGNLLAVSFDDAGHLLSLVARGGARTAMEYDTRGRVVRRDTSGAVTSFSYDDQDRLVSVTDAEGGLTGYAYDGASRIASAITDPNGAVTRQSIEDGLVTSRTDPVGATTRFDYDAGRHLIAVTDALGRRVQLEYDAAGRCTAVTTPLGATNRFAYDAPGRVISTADALGRTTSFDYSASGLLLDITDADGATTRFEYDGLGNRTAATDPLGRTTAYAYDSDGNVIRATDPAGTASVYTHDAHGRMSAVTVADEVVVSYAYDVDGVPTQRTDAAGTETRAYDGRGNLLSVTDPLGRTSRYEYDLLDRLVAEIDPTGAVWRTAYDGAGRVMSRTDPLGNVTRYEYDTAGRLSATIDPLGNTTRYAYDDAGRLVEVVDAKGGVTSYEYDADDRRIALTTPAGLVTRYEYDASGRLIRQINPRGGATTYEYSERGQRTAMTSPAGAVRRWAYDASGQLVSQSDPKGAITSYSYDDAGRLVTMTDAKGAATRYAYDSLGRQTSSTDPLGRVTQQVYDAVGNLVSVTDPAGAALRMEYDAAGQLLRRIAADGATVEFEYDLAGRRVRMIDGTGTTRYGYDAAGRRVSATQPDGSLYTSTYDAAGRRVQLRYPDGLAIDYRFDPTSRLVGLNDPRAGDITYTLDPDGRLLSEALPDGWERTYKYRGGLLESFQEKRGGARSEDTILTRDLDDRIVTQADHGHRTEFQYDPAGQLIAVTGHRAGLKLGYDAVGNRVSMKRGGVETRYTYDAADQLVASDRGPHHVDYTYDAAGRLIAQVGHNERIDIQYNSFGLPAVTTLGHGGVTQTREAVYNGAGLLTSVETSRSPGNPPPLTSTVRYHWTVGEPVQQILRQEGDGEADFVYGYGRALAHAGEGHALFARDVYGSAVRTAQTKDWVQAMSYGPFGEPDTAGMAQLSNPRFGYRGELAFGSSVYLRARTYDTEQGRFNARDPVATLIGQTDAMSPYVYGNNSPANFTDPQGRFSILSSFAAQLSALIALQRGPWDCPDPGDSIDAHPKCFQSRSGLKTRGFIPQDCLDARDHCLNKLWNTHQKERAAQAVAINEQNKRREGWWQRFLDDQLNFGTTVHRDVDWEVKPDNAYVFDQFRVDIVTDEKNLYEVKAWSPSAHAEVEAQIGNYLFLLDWNYGVRMQRGTEFQDWASLFIIHDSWDDYIFGGDEVYVWGLDEPAGHVYFSKSEKVPAAVRAKAERKYDENSDEPHGGSIPIPVPVRPPILVP